MAALATALLLTGCLRVGHFPSVEVSPTFENPGLADCRERHINGVLPGPLHHAGSRMAYATMMGKIVAVEEGDGVRVVVATDGGDVVVGLGEGVLLRRGLETVSPSALRAGQDVVVSGSFGAGRGTAARVDLVERLDGRIDEIMEVDPLRLSVNTAAGSRYVQLEEDTSILSAGGSVGPGDLTVGSTVVVWGFDSGNVFVARAICVTSTDQSDT